MKHRESLKLYCMRLKEMAQRAFPNSEKECAKQLRRKFMSTAPATFLDRVEKREETKDMLELGKKLTWGEIVDLAEKEDKKRRKAAYYNKIDDDSDQDMRERLQRLKCSTVGATKKISPSKIFTNSQFVGGQDRSGNAFVSCQWCGKPGHVEAKCWIKLGACTLCGSANHKRDECSKFKKQRDYPTSPTCSLCGGPHLGKNCCNSGGKIVLPSLIGKSATRDNLN